MSCLSDLSKEELLAMRNCVEKEYNDTKAKGLKLNMARGLPSVEQLDMESDFFDVLTSESVYKSETGIECRNYGELTGISEAKKLMGEMMGIPAENVMIFGNSSLNIMYDTVARSMSIGFSNFTLLGLNNCVIHYGWIINKAKK